MKLQMYQRIKLNTGKTAHVIEIFGGGAAYMVDIDMGNGEYTQKTITPAEIKSVIIEVEQAYASA